jgi:sugar O-acyltransferase (sialic acid O-acetyltransferase NeuD family)
VTSLVILGGHSSGLIVCEAAAAAGLDVAGFLNDTMDRGELLGGLPVLGRFEDWSLLGPDSTFIAAFPLPGSSRRVVGRLRDLAIPLDRLTSVVHPSASVSPRARLGPGCFVAPGAVIEHGAVVGAHSIIRAGAYASHDVTLGELCFFGPSSTALGRSSFGDGAHVGANAVVREGISVGAFALIGIGSTVIRDVAADTTVAGSPARLVAPSA